MYLPLDSGSLNDLHNFFPTAIILEAGPRRLPRCFKIPATDQLITFPAKMRGGDTTTATRGADQLITFPAKMGGGATVTPKPQGRFRAHNLVVKRRSGPRQRGFAALAQPAAGLKHEKQQACQTRR